MSTSTSKPLTISIARFLLKYLVIFGRFVCEHFSRYVYKFLYRNTPKHSIPPIDDALLLLPASELAARIRKRELKSRDVVEAYITRNKQINHVLNAVIAERFHEALREAEEIDEILDAGDPDKKFTEESAPFVGVPFSAKEAMMIKGLPNSSGLMWRKNFIAPEDADTVSLMRQAGGIPIASTNVSELCMWWESSNNVYGRTCNAYDHRRIVGGSSGGEGCLISAAGSVIGIGSDIGGSIRMPCFFNGIFGHKPTTGIVSNEGQFPNATDKHVYFLVTGPMCRYATDLTPMYKVLAGSNCTKLKLDEKVNLKSLKIYSMEDDGGSPIITPVSKEIKAAQQKVAKHFKEAVGCSVEKIHLKLMKYGLQIWAAMMADSDSPTFAQEMSPDQVTPVDCGRELLKWLTIGSNHTLPAIGLGLAEKASRADEKPIAMCESLKKEVCELLGDDGVLLYPSHPTSALYHNQPLFVMYNFAYTAIFNVLGVPVTQCPLGLNSEGLPIGIQVVGSHYNDHLCIAVAQEIEKAFGGWVPPQKS